MKKRYIPNIMSLARIPFSIALPFLAGRHDIAFLVCYLLCGFFDVFDGVVARRFHWESKLGEKMDTLGDVVFIVCTIVAVMLTLGPTLAEDGLAGYVYVIIGVFAAIRAFNVALTKIKFNRWGVIHLRSARWSIIPLYILFPICIQLGKVFNPFVALCLVLSALAAVEEIFILFAMEKDEYTMSLKSYWEWKRDREKLRAYAAEAVPDKEAVLR